MQDSFYLESFPQETQISKRKTQKINLLTFLGRPKTAAEKIEEKKHIHEVSKASKVALAPTILATIAQTEQTGALTEYADDSLQVTFFKSPEYTIMSMGKDLFTSDINTLVLYKKPQTVEGVPYPIWGHATITDAQGKKETYYLPESFSFSSSLFKDQEK